MLLLEKSKLTFGVLEVIYKILPVEQSLLEPSPEREKGKETLSGEDERRLCSWGIKFEFVFNQRFRYAASP